MNGQTGKGGSLPHDAADPGDEILVDRARTGDMVACDALMRRHKERLYRAIRSVLKTGSDVDDAMQDTYLAALRSLDQFEGRAHFGTWLLKIGTNAALARMRQRMRVVQLDDLPDSGDLEPHRDVGAAVVRTPEQHVSNFEIAAIIEEAIERLPYDYQQVFVLRMIDGLDTTGTAEELGLGEDAVRQRLHRAREMLQAALQGQSDGAVGVAVGVMLDEGNTDGSVRSDHY